MISEKEKKIFKKYQFWVEDSKKNNVEDRALCESCGSCGGGGGGGCSCGG